MKILAGCLAGILVLLGLLVLGSRSASACTAGPADPAAASSHAPVAGYSGDQLVNAATIMNAATGLGLGTDAQVIGVMTAMGESSLRNITYGDDLNGVTNPDGTPTSSIGLFQQQAWWGSTAQRMDPTAAATLFFQRLTAVPGWQQLSPTRAAHAVQVNSDPDYYASYAGPAAAVVSALAGASASCTATSTDARQLAGDIVTAMDAGTIVGPDSDLDPIRDIAAGRVVPNCGVDVRILQVITIAYRTFGKLGISSINRLCHNDIIGAGIYSAHYRNGGGHAVDFNSLGGVATTGADANAVQLLQTLDPVMPDGSGTGQSDCRADAGTSLALAHMRQFPDSCTHVHVEVDPDNTNPLRTNG